MTAAAYRVAVLAVAVGLAACQAQDPEPAADPAGPGSAMSTATAAPGGTAATASPAAGPATSVSGIVESQWECDGQHVATRFDNTAGTVSVTHERGELLLQQATSASGARYADANGNEFWNKGDQATLTLSGTPPRQCRDVGAPQR